MLRGPTFSSAQASYLSPACYASRLYHSAVPPLPRGNALLVSARSNGGFSAKKVSKNALCPSTSAPLLSQGQFIFLFVFCIGVFQPELALFLPTAVGAAGAGRLFSLFRHADLRWNLCPPAWGKDSASHGLLRSIYSEETEAQWFHRTRRAHAKSTDLSNRAGTAVHEKQRQCLLRTRRDGNEKKKAAKHRVASAKRGAIPL